jgi:hypothetical protein
MSDYRITTKDGTGEFNFFTKAKNSKEALKAMIERSTDFSKIVNGKKDLTITVSKLK